MHLPPTLPIHISTPLSLWLCLAHLLRQVQRITQRRQGFCKLRFCRCQSVTPCKPCPSRNFPLGVSVLYKIAFCLLIHLDSVPFHAPSTVLLDWAHGEHDVGVWVVTCTFLCSTRSRPVHSADSSALWQALQLRRSMNNRMNPEILQPQ